MPMSAKRLQRKEHQLLASYVLSRMSREAHSMASQHRNLGQSLSAEAADDTARFIDSHGAEWIEAALDGYQPLIDVARAVNELDPAVALLSSIRQSNRILYEHLRDRIEASLRILRGIDGV